MNIPNEPMTADEPLAEPTASGAEPTPLAADSASDAVRATDPTLPGTASAAGAGPGMRVYEAETGDLLTSQQRDPLLRHLTRVIVDLARRHAPPAACPAAIDIGCGVGRTSMALAAAGYRVVGVDPGERVIGLATDLARRRGDLAGRIAFYAGDATAAPPEAWRASFDLAVCSEVIEHVVAPEAVLAYAAAVLRPGGILILTTPHDRRQWTRMDDYAGHVTRFSPDELRGLLADWALIELGTEGFPFQRTVMKAYDRQLRARGAEHRIEAFGNSPAYRAYLALMPWLLQVDHAFRSTCRGTTWVAVARRSGEGGEVQASRRP